VYARERLPRWPVANLILDEYASIAQEAWTEVLRPALADRQGRALFIGTPRGYKMVNRNSSATDLENEQSVYGCTIGYKSPIAVQGGVAK
jgi:hypothetical protein